MMKNYFESLASYNSWANAKMRKMIAMAGDERANREQKSSFPTILLTVRHICDAQYIWLKRLRGEPVTNLPGDDSSGSVSDACEFLVENSRHFEDFVRSMPDDGFDREVAYHNSKGVPFTNTVGQIVAHVMNHGTYHRGQLVTLLRGAGFEAPEATDLIAYFREINRNRAT